MLLFSDLVSEVKRLSIRDQSGSEFDSEIKNGLNESLFRIARDANWTKLRRYGTFDTVTTYTEGTGAVTVTNDSKNVSVVGATFITDDINIGRRVTLGGSTQSYIITSITGETTFTVNRVYDGTTVTNASYTIWPQEIYNLPVQCDKIGFLWHEISNQPYVMQYVPSLEFFQSNSGLYYSTIPTFYRIWAEDMAMRQPNEASIVSVVSSGAADTTQSVTIFGTVSGYPDQDTISLTGTTSASGTKQFTEIDRVAKNAPSVGRITCTTNSGNVTIAVIPAGDTTAGIMYKKVIIWPLPSVVAPINVWFYKEPYRMVNDGDVHELGQEFDHAIILLTVAKIRYQNNQKEGDRFLTMYTDEMKSLRRQNADRLDYLNMLRRPEHSTFTDQGIHSQVLYQQLGGQFGPASFR